ncbi:MAG: deoxyribose-phosphate aldolase [Flavobacteriaceae bacterium]|nr:deoxyribose-phosphate aldolase [Flavobacteriaceae bacterium]
MRSLVMLIVIVFISSCKPEIKVLTAQEVIDTSIIASGADKISAAAIDFDFRNRHYSAVRNNGKFSLIRITKNETTETKDILSNTGFERFRNDAFVIVPDSMAIRYSGSVNSVHYFAVLPFGLNDAAVKKKLLKEATIKGITYYKVEVRFSEDGGGEDFDDVFVYWVNKQDFKIEYLAYSYHVNGGGKRFRKATNERIINGIRFVDYINYKATNASTKLENLDKAFENSELKKLSEINLDNVQVKLLDD